MKSFLLTFLLTCTGLQASWSQGYHPFPDTNATWCDVRYDAAWPAPNYYYLFYKTDGKININDTLYTVISDQDNLTRCYLRENDGKVYCRLSPGSTEFKLYDFSLQPGDTMALFQLNSGMFWDGVVDQIDSVLIGTEYHRRFHIDCPDWLSCHFIEGIGSDLGFMYCDIPWVDLWGELRCFSFNDSIYETDGTGGITPGNCWVYLNIPEDRPASITVYPNPAQGIIFISGHQKYFLELYDALGKLRIQTFASSIELTGLAEGIYILNVYSENKALIKQAKIIRLNAY